jgi:hypothetical protein
MPTPTINLQPYKSVITNWFYENITSQDIAKKLAIDYNIACTACTIQRQLKEYRTTKQVQVKETTVLIGT